MSKFSDVTLRRVQHRPHFGRRVRAAHGRVEARKEGEIPVEPILHTISALAAAGLVLVPNSKLILERASEASFHNMRDECHFFYI
jgi:hypothetical protein